ncbi:hypothetical protein ISCGN_011175 [Ixodes scapularis]
MSGILFVPRLFSLRTPVVPERRGGPFFFSGAVPKEPVASSPHSSNFTGRQTGGGGARVRSLASSYARILTLVGEDLALGAPGFSVPAFEDEAEGDPQVPRQVRGSRQPSRCPPPHGGAPVKAGVWRVASPRTPSHAGSPAHVWLCVAFPCLGKRASWWLSRARGRFGPFGAPRVRQYTTSAPASHRRESCSEDEILEGLRASRVVAVKRIMTRRDGAEVRTKHLILTFERHTLPALVKAGYLNCRVRPYVPNPQRCFRCQRFGHGSRSCRGRETCAKCGSHDHVADVCEDPVACANCKGSHPAYSRSCPLWRQEKEILTLRAKENLSYPEAKQRFSFISKGTYSDAVRRNPALRTESRATQFSLEDLAGPSQAPKQPAGKQGAPGNAGSTQTPQSIQARPPADRQPRASSSSQGGERGRRSNPSEAARLVSEQQGPPAAPSTSKDESVNVGGSRPGTSKTSSAGSSRGRKLVVQVSDHVGTGKPASKVQDAEGAVDIADSSAPSSDQEDMEWQTAKSKQKVKKPVVPP